MTTQEAIMTTQEVANRFHELAQSGQWDQIQNELYATNAVSIEMEGMPGAPQKVEGMDAIKGKLKHMMDNTEQFHGGYCSAPLVAGRFFTVAMGMDVTMKERGRMNMEEIAVYEVKDGKIVKEQFFY